MADAQQQFLNRLMDKLSICEKRQGEFHAIADVGEERIRAAAEGLSRGEA